MAGTSIQPPDATQPAPPLTIRRGTPVGLAQATPNRATRVRLPSEYGPIAALTTGAATARATVLLVPGYTGSKEDFAPLLDPIADAGLAAVAIDQPGQYESPGPDDEAAYLSAPLGTVLAGVIERLGPRPVLLLGHSYGGLVSRAAVLAGADVAGLVLMCSGPAALPDGNRRVMLDLAEPVLREQGVMALQNLREAVDAHAGLPPRAAELETLLRERFVASSRAALLGMATGLRTEPDRVDELTARLRATSTPSLVTCGERDDAWTPEIQHEMARRMAAPFEPVPDSVHSPNVENPDALLELLLRTWAAWLDS